MSAKVINSYAQHVLNESARASDHADIINKIQNIHRGSIEELKYKRVPLGLVETLEFSFMDFSKVRMTVYVGMNGNTRMSLKLLKDKEN